MPFIGLLDKHGKEIKGDGYHRIDMSDIIFKISPPNDPDMHYVFVNLSMVVWPAAKRAWPEIHGCCIFSEIDDKEPAVVRKFCTPPRRLKERDTLAIAPGQLAIQTAINSPRDWTRDLKPPKPPGQRARCPECGKLLTK